MFQQVNSVAAQKRYERSHEVFENLIRENGPALYQYIYSLVRHKELAEDLYQEVTLAAFLAFSTFEERAKFKNWIFKIAVNKCRDYWRKEKTSRDFWTEKVFDYSREIQHPVTPEEKVAEMDFKEEIVETIQGLPEIYRDPLLLFYYDNRTLLEIGDETRVPISTVKTRMRRGRERLRPLLKTASK